MNPPIVTNLTINPTVEQHEALRFNNEAQRLSREGDYRGAERLHLRAIALKEQGYGLNHFTTALSWNALGELYIEMGRLDESEDYLKKAVRVRNAAAAENDSHAFDAAVSRDNLARIYEMRGDMKQAKATRLSGGQTNLACSNFSVCYISLSQVFSTETGVNYSVYPSDLDSPAIIAMWRV
ncbi:hypothetical protein SCP_0108420 [Sparassis crispa]|uniref:Uncharacterized protein n=1 Tax=Sparassis crispa TaxID=139825 RepID=A0A401G717_9APHY|nr:hypothetical protein SCP_0108420 [Sparassis crispa]GBE77960.1 hypothetical protein SCP_0108420 [Sparassis crispa]